MHHVTGMLRQVVLDKDVYVADMGQIRDSFSSPFGLARGREDIEASYSSTLSVPYVSRRHKELVVLCWNAVENADAQRNTVQ
jgi:hypothetical protein